MKSAFIIVIYNQPETETGRLKKELIGAGYADKDIFVIDNSKENRGYAGGVNAGIRMAVAAGYDTFAIANGDISVKGLAKKDMTEAAAEFDIWGLAMEQKEATYYGGEIDKMRMSGGLISGKPDIRFKRADFVSGSLMFIKKGVVDRIGYLNEHFFMYYEDVEYCYRAAKAGFRVGIDSRFVYRHFENSENMDREKKRYLAVNRLRFLLKYGSIIQKLYEFIRLPKTTYEERGVIAYSFLKSRFLVNFLSLNISSFVEKFLHFVLFLFLVRILSPQDYGIYTLVWAQTALLGPLVDLGTTSYGLVFLSNEKKERFRALFNLRFVLSLAVFVLTIILSFFTLQFKTDLVFYTFLTSFVIFANMFSGTFLIWSAMKEKVYMASLVSFLSEFVLVTGLIVSLTVSRRLAPLFAVLFVVYNLYSLVNYLILKKELGSLKFAFTPKVWLEIVRKSYIFVLIGIFANLYFKFDVFILNYLKSEREVGIYTAGYKFLEALMFVASSYSFVATPIISRLARENLTAFKRKIRKDIVLLAGIGLSVSAAIFFLAPVFLPVFLKGNYNDSIRVARTVVLALTPILITTIYLNSLYVLDKAYLVVFLFIFQALINLVLNFIFIPRYSYMASAWITVIGEVLNVFVVYALYKLALSHKHENRS